VEFGDVATERRSDGVEGERGASLSKRRRGSERDNQSPKREGGDNGGTRSSDEAARPVPQASLPAPEATNRM